MKMKRRWRNKKKKVKIRRSEVEGQAANMAARNRGQQSGATPTPSLPQGQEGGRFGPQGRRQLAKGWRPGISSCCPHQVMVHQECNRDVDITGQRRPGQEQDVPVGQRASVWQQGGHKLLPEFSNPGTGCEEVKGILNNLVRASGAEGGRLHTKAGQAATQREDIMEKLKGDVGLLSHHPRGPKGGSRWRPREDLAT